MAGRRVLVLAGPTAVGKTALSLRLAAAAQGTAQAAGGLRDPAAAAKGPLPAVEIVSGDSVQIYRGLDIGSAKASADVRAAVLHHLIDELGFNDSYSAVDFAKRAREVIRDVLARGRLPCVVGGSGFYLNALTQPPRATSRPDAAALARAHQLIQADGGDWQRSLARLATVDPEYAASLSGNDYYRLERGTRRML